MSKATSNSKMTRNTENLIPQIEMSFDSFATGDATLEAALNKSSVYFPGDDVTFTLTIKNKLTAAIDNVKIEATISDIVKTDTIKVGSNADGTGATLTNSNTVSYSIDSLEAGDTKVYIFGKIKSL